MNCNYGILWSLKRTSYEDKDKAIKNHKIIKIDLILQGITSFAITRD
jgi:hypothetical protein